MQVITNISDQPIVIDGVSIDPGLQLDVQAVTQGMLDAQANGTLRILSGDETLSERQADIKAMGDLV